MSTDYRETKYCGNIFSNIRKKKRELLNKIKIDHPRAENIYNLLNPSGYRSDFMDVYQCKCAYCGVSNRLIPSSFFEIDHIIPKSSEYFRKHKEENANCLENLALACRTCNKNKSDFESNSKDFHYLHPDNEEISSVFERDNKYYIRISRDHKSNKTIGMFYKQVGLGSQIHRLDYILMSLLGLRDKYPNIPELDQAILLLMQRRNYIA